MCPLISLTLLCNQHFFIEFLTDPLFPIYIVRDESFLRQRSGMINLTYLLGASAWGSLILSFSVFILMTLTAFLFRKCQSMEFPIYQS